MSKPEIERIKLTWTDGKDLEMAIADFMLCWRYVDHNVERLRELLRTMAELPDSEGPHHITVEM